MTKMVDDIHSANQEKQGMMHQAKYGHEQGK